MKHSCLILLIAFVHWSCTDANSTAPDQLDAGAAGHFDTDARDAGHAGNRNDTQLDAAVPDRDDATAVSNSSDAEADAEVSPYADLRTCSGNPLDTVSWPCAAEAATCDDATRTSQMCALPWGCDEYELAVVAAADECGQGYSQVITAQACGRTVIELRVGAGSPTRAFYSASGGLMGIWSMTDVLSDPQSCSGFVPKDCLDWEGDSLNNIVDLCAPSDASADAADAH